MEDCDLQIDNYDIDDILNLFHLDYHFTKAHLKQAQKMALQTHPDKSHLPSEYFIFFMKAYKLLCKIYYFRFRKEDNSREYQVDMNEEQKLLLDNLGKDKFNKWFNEMFEQIKISDNNQDTGYETWFRSDADITEVKKVSLSQFGKEFEKHKKNCKEIVKSSGLKEMGGESGYNLLREKPDSYSSTIFSQLPFEDLRKAHTETVIPVSREDYLKKQKFTNLESYRRHRQSQETAPLSLQQSEDFLSQKNKNATEGDIRRIYKILKQDEQIMKSNDKWWSSIKQLTNQ